jgi:hypothetical protein
VIPNRSTTGPSRQTLGVRWDIAVVTRPPTTGDADGNPVGTETSVYPAVYGSWILPTTKEREVAAQRDQTVDAVFGYSNIYTLRDGDILALRGGTWEVVQILNVRTHNRAYLRKR